MDLKYVAFAKLMNRVYKIDDEILKTIYKQFNYVTVKKNQFFLMQGDASNTLAVIAEGLFKSSFINEEGNEFIKYFLTKNDFLVGNLQYSKPSNVSIQAIEDSSIFTIDHRAFDVISEKYSSLREMKSAVVAEYLERKEQREMQLLSNDAKKNYELFVKEYSDLSRYLSQYHIAMYLGITPTQLSRIKKHISQHM